MARAQKDRDYSHRDVVDKLGIKPGCAIAFDAAPLEVDADLRARALARAGRDDTLARAGRDDTLARAGRDDTADEPLDVVLVGADASTEVEAVLQHWRARIDRAGGIWLLTPKRGQPGYVDQRELILAGPSAGVADNKTCSVSDTLSGIRFVIRKVNRVYS